VPRLRGDAETQNAAEVGEAVVAAKTGFVAEKQQHAGEGQGLGHDREIHALDPRAEGEETEHQRQQSRRQHHQTHSPEEMLVPTQYHGSSVHDRNVMNAGKLSPDASRIRYMPIA
jgi:hypothetical protein